MTTATVATSRTAASSTTTGGALTGTATLVRFMLRRDRVKLPAWAGGLGLLVVYFATAVPSAFGSEQELRGAVGLYSDPVGRMLIGPGYGFDAPTFERFVANGYGLYLLILAALMNILLVVRHTRVEEQTGRAELVRANVVGRYAALTATLAVAVITNLAAGLLVFVAMAGAGGFGAGGSVLLGAGIGAVGLAFAGVTTITVQLSEYSRAAAGMAGAVLGAAFVLRAGGDMAAEGGNALSWVSPLAWGQQTAPFVLDRWWPLILPLAFAVLTAAVGYALSARRDLGASLVAVRPGRSVAAPSLGTPLGLALRLQRASIIGWGIALAIAGLTFGAFADGLLSAADEMPASFVELFGAGDMLAGYLGYIVVFMAFLAGAYAIMAVQGWRTEEASGRSEPVLSTAVSRSAWLGANLLVTAGGVFVIMLATGVASGIGAAVVTGDGAHIADLTLAHLNHIPAVLVVLGVGALLFGVIPRAVPAVWVLVGYAMIVGTFGPLLDLPQTAYNLSPFEHPAEMPLETFAGTPVVILIVVSAIGGVLGLAAFRRRGINVT